MPSFFKTALICALASVSMAKQKLRRTEAMDDHVEGWHGCFVDCTTSEEAKNLLVDVHTHLMDYSKSLGWDSLTECELEFALHGPDGTKLKENAALFQKLVDGYEQVAAHFGHSDIYDAGPLKELLTSVADGDFECAARQNVPPYIPPTDCNDFVLSVDACGCSCSTQFKTNVCQFTSDQKYGLLIAKRLLWDTKEFNTHDNCKFIDDNMPFDLEGVPCTYAAYIDKNHYISEAEKNLRDHGVSDEHIQTLKEALEWHLSNSDMSCGGSFTSNV